MDRMTLKSVTPIRVRYADTDQMRIVYYGKFFEYFEQGRSDLLRDVGFPYGHLEEMGFHLPVIEAHAEYKRAARYDDLLLVATILRDVPVARVRIDYEITREGATDLLVNGYTVHGFVNSASGKPTRAPALFAEAVETAMKKER
jgi:acyl-CoA thioester hydrolase